MPYAPNVTDRSGEIRAQGYLEKVRGISMGAEGIAKQYAENKFRNQAIQGQNEALLKQFITDPEMEKFAPEGATKLIEKAQQGGGLSLADNIKLNGYLNTTLSTRKAIQEQQMEAQKKALMQQQVQMNQIEMAKAQRAQQMEMARQAQLQQLDRDYKTVNEGVGSGVLLPGVQDAARKRMSAAESNPFLAAQMQARQAGVDLPPAVLAEYAIQNKKASAPGELEIGTIGFTKDGKPMVRSVDKRTGQVLGERALTEGQRPVLTPEEEASKIEQVGRAEWALKANNALLEASSAASDTVRDVDRAVRLLEDPAVYTGTGGDLALVLKRAGSVLGAPVDGVTKAEELQNLLGDRILQRVNQTKGAVSDKEMSLFESWSASMSKTKEGNKAILTALKTKAARDRKAAALVREMRKAGKKEGEINEAVDALINEMPLFEPKVEQMLAPAAEPAAASAWNDELERELVERRARAQAEAAARK